jgi:hypothetical protein
VDLDPSLLNLPVVEEIGFKDSSQGKDGLGFTLDPSQAMTFPVDPLIVPTIPSLEDSPELITHFLHPRHARSRRRPRLRGKP